jgi:hypothetical protein
MSGIGMHRILILPDTGYPAGYPVRAGYRISARISSRILDDNYILVKYQISLLKQL